MKEKITIPIAIVIAAAILGLSLYLIQVSKQKSIKRQQQIEMDQREQEKLEEQQAKEESEQALNTCVADAESNYHDRWHEECKAQGKLTSKCIELKELSYGEYLEKYGLTNEEYIKQRNITPPITPNDPDNLSIFGSAFLDYLERQEECSCRLLVSTADRFNESLEKDKAECFNRYPQK